MIIPQTRREAIDLYNERIKSKKKKTKYDMLLGGLICCSDAEFKAYSCCEVAEIVFFIPWNGGVVG